ncbi:hypothetical protein [Catellatospora chokoriensis]|uniref:Uncharacterized protein n=1 Tax=Catellatospora chokoriensis TaxID=310353 RepID=A0A8J3NVG1_9ACTN|nr:hypothetical protein [Catellatospora chokoriensis]GIF94030.1 hypothetical protein Cch02nite_74740 [Catellatospora chokoriensis]
MNTKVTKMQHLLKVFGTPDRVEAAQRGLLAAARDATAMAEHMRQQLDAGAFTTGFVLPAGARMIAENHEHSAAVYGELANQIAAAIAGVDVTDDDDG